MQNKMLDTSLHRTHQIHSAIGKSIDAYSKRYLAHVFIQIMARESEASDSHTRVEQENIANTMISISEGALKSGILQSKFEIVPEHPTTLPAIPESHAPVAAVPDQNEACVKDKVEKKKRGRKPKSATATTAAVTAADQDFLAPIVKIRKQRKSNKK